MSDREKIEQAYHKQQQALIQPDEMMIGLRLGEATHAQADKATEIYQKHMGRMRHPAFGVQGTVRLLPVTRACYQELLTLGNNSLGTSIAFEDHGQV